MNCIRHLLSITDHTQCIPMEGFHGPENIKEANSFIFGTKKYIQYIIIKAGKRPPAIQINAHFHIWGNSDKMTAWCRTLFVQNLASDPVHSGVMFDFCPPKQFTGVVIIIFGGACVLLMSPKVKRQHFFVPLWKIAINRRWKAAQVSLSTATSNKNKPKNGKNIKNKPDQKIKRLQII